VRRTVFKQAALSIGRPGVGRGGRWWSFRRKGRRSGWGVAVGVPLLLLASFGCARTSLSREIDFRDLVDAEPHRPHGAARFVISDPAALGPLYNPLGKRMGLVQVRDEAEWAQLRRAVPQIGACPDLRGGIVVGLVCPAGTSLSGQWPFAWDTVRVYRGAGLIEAEFNGGSYLPDSTTYLEAAQIDGLSAVLVVAVDGIHYLPQ